MNQKIGYNYLNSQVAELDKLEREAAAGKGLVLDVSWNSHVSFLVEGC